MKRSSALLFQVSVVLVGLGVLTLLLWEPHVEGRNARATLFEIYFKDPFLAYVHLGSTPFFIALYRAFGLFGHLRQQGTYSQVTVDALRAIKHCALILIGLVALGAVFILILGDGEDRPAGIFMCLLVSLCGGVVALTATLFARALQRTLSA